MSKTFVVSSHQTAEIHYKVEADDQEEATRKVMNEGAGELVGVNFGDLWEGKAEANCFDVTDDDPKKWHPIREANIY